MLDNIITILGFSTVKDVLQVVLIPSTLALLASFATRRWQERERELEIKTQLVSEISELVMTTAMTAYLFNLDENKENSSQHDELHRTYKRWRIETCVIGSKLHAYFPDAHAECGLPIHHKWTRFSEQITAYYESGMYKPYGNSEEHLSKDKEALFKEKASIIEEILRSNVRWDASKNNR
jgi:hypothetical protein